MSKNLPEHPEHVRFDVKWTIKNISLWNSECHGSSLKMPVSKDVWFDLMLFPKGVNGTKERLNVHWMAARCLPIGKSIIRLVYYGSDEFPLAKDEVVNNEVINEPIELHSGPKFVDVIKSRNDTIVLHCIFLVCFSNYSTVFSEVFSSINVMKYSVKLMKYNFENLALNSNDTILFNFDHNNSSLIDFTLSFRENCFSLEKSFSYFYVKMKRSTKKYFIKCVFALENEYNYIAKHGEYFHLFGISEKTQSWAIPPFLSRKELLQRVALHVHFFISQNQAEELYINPNKSKELKDSLSSDFLSLYQDQNFSDFEIRCGKMSFPVNKTVLIARSPVLKTMCSTNLKEVDSGILEIPDADIHTMGRFLTFLYSAELHDLQWESALKLYDMADKYEVLSLREACSSILNSSFSVSNVCEILSFADLHSDEKLKNAVQDFIIDNFECVISSDEWKNCLEKQPLLFGKVITFICNQKFVMRN